MRQLPGWDDPVVVVVLTPSSPRQVKTTNHSQTLPYGVSILNGKQVNVEAARVRAESKRQAAAIHATSC